MNLEVTLPPSSDPTSIKGLGRHTSSLTFCLNYPSKNSCGCPQQTPCPPFEDRKPLGLAGLLQRPTTQDTRTECPIHNTHRVFLQVTEAFLFAHKTTGDLACEDLGDYNVDTLGSRHLGSKVTKTVTRANHTTTELGFPAGFQVVKFGCCSSKEAVRTHRDGTGQLTSRGSCSVGWGPRAARVDTRSRGLIGRPVTRAEAPAQSLLG